jgi:hypothetical protein
MYLEPICKNCTFADSKFENNQTTNIMRSFFAIISMLVLFTACQNQNSKTNPDGTHMVVVKEVLQAGTEYTYLHVKEGDAESWLAVPKMDAKEGETLYYMGGLKLTNFESKELKRTFPEVYFLNGISREPIVNGADGSQPMVSPHMTQPQVEKADIKIEPARDGITIAKLFTDMKSYEGKKVTIKAQVVKYNPEIMNKNWIHIQDGTDFEGKFDLTVTSAAEVAVGDVITLEGTISLNKDFGAGYAYDVIMEDAVLK